MLAFLAFCFFFSIYKHTITKRVKQGKGKSEEEAHYDVGGDDPVTITILWRIVVLDILYPYYQGIVELQHGRI